MRSKPRDDARKAAPPPLDPGQLEQLALGYAARYATTRARLMRYLDRKLKERGWDHDTAPDLDGLIARLADLRYVDDAAYATARGAALGRRGYGARRIAGALDAAGVSGADRLPALDDARHDAWNAADRFARRRRIGPYAMDAAPRDVREKQVAAFLRAGHDFATARRWVEAEPGEPPERPDGEHG